MKTSLLTGLNQALFHGFSMGRPLRNNYSTADYVSYLNNLNTHISTGMNGFSIIASGLTTSNFNAAANALTMSLAAIPSTANLLGLKYMKLGLVTNARSRYWVYMTNEIVPPNFDQRIFTPYDYNVGTRITPFNSISISDHIKSINSDSF
jgi:hypothetical protein